MGVFLKQLARTQEAIEHFLAATRLNSPAAHAELSEIYRAQHKHDLFAEHLKLAAASDEPSAIFNLAYAHDSDEFSPHIPRDLPLAMTLYQKAASMNVASALYNLGYKYMYGEDVDQDINRGVKLFKRAYQLGHKPAASELGTCYLKGLCNKGVPNVAEARNKFNEAYAADILAAGHNLAHTYYEESIAETDAVKRQSAITKMVALWSELSERRHPGSAFNLGTLYAMGIGVVRDFFKADQFYNRAGEFGVQHAYTNLALLIMEEYMQTKDRARSTELLHLFSAAIQNGVKNDDPYAQMIWDLHAAYARKSGEQDYKTFWETIKYYRHTSCIAANQDVCEISRDTTLSPLRRIEKIFSLTVETVESSAIAGVRLSHEDDGINVATKILNIGKLFQQSDYDASFLRQNLSKILSLIALINSKVEHLGWRGITDVLCGITHLPLDPRQPTLFETLRALSHRLNIILETERDIEVNFHRLLPIHHALTKLGTFPPAIPEFQVSQALLGIIVRHLPDSIDPSVISSLLYDAALLENHWDLMAPQYGVKHQTFFFGTETLSALLRKVPRHDASIPVALLTQFYMACKVILTNSRIPLAAMRLEGQARDNLERYCIIDATHRSHMGALVTTSQLQRRVATVVRNILSSDAAIRIQEEAVMGVLPVDILVSGVTFKLEDEERPAEACSPPQKGSVVIQVDGPRHFLFNESDGKVLSPQELLRNRVLRCTLPPDARILHIPFDAWDRASAAGNSVEYIRGALQELCLLPPVPRISASPEKK
jgi:TPR repeat protein